MWSVSYLADQGFSYVFIVDTITGGFDLHLVDDECENFKYPSHPPLKLLFQYLFILRPDDF